MSLEQSDNVSRLSTLIISNRRSGDFFCVPKIGGFRKVAFARNSRREERNYGAGRRISMRRRRNWPGSLNAISWRIAMEIRILATRELRTSLACRTRCVNRTRDSNVISFHVTRESRLNDFASHGKRIPFRFATRSEFLLLARREPNFILERNYRSDATRHPFQWESNFFQPRFIFGFDAIWIFFNFLNFSILHTIWQGCMIYFEVTQSGK